MNNITLGIVVSLTFLLLFGCVSKKEELNNTASPINTAPLNISDDESREIMDALSELENISSDEKFFPPEEENLSDNLEAPGLGPK